MVIGWSRVPDPPARMMPFNFRSLLIDKDSQQLGGIAILEFRELR